MRRSAVPSRNDHENDTRLRGNHPESGPVQAGNRSALAAGVDHRVEPRAHEGSKPYESEQDGCADHDLPVVELRRNVQRGGRTAAVNIYS